MLNRGEESSLLPGTPIPRASPSANVKVVFPNLDNWLGIFKQAYKMRIDVLSRTAHRVSTASDPEYNRPPKPPKFTGQCIAHTKLDERIRNRTRRLPQLC